jgi:hypothetical protein
LTYQFLLFVVIGALLSLAYRELQRQRDETATVRELRREFLTRAIDAYNAAKKVRRLLRARARQHDQVTNMIQIRGVIYDEQMQLLADAQLRLETLKHLAESDFSLFPGIATALESMEEYLGEIVKEYEEKNLSFTGQPPALPLASLGEVEEFMAPYKKPRFTGRRTA